ncbi:MAG: hypothetical protein HY314_09805 [Acidobacteria bacterium]|nr:hypothetical protein [Acidobacteriota bacterium]
MRYTPRHLKRESENVNQQRSDEINRELDALNERLMIALQRSGDAYLSNARVRGRFALRGCVLNYRTTERDMEILLDAIRRIADRLDAG